MLFFWPLLFATMFVFAIKFINFQNHWHQRFIEKKCWWDVILLATSFCDCVCIWNQIYQLPKSLTLKIFLNDWQWDLNLLATSFLDRVCICNQIYQLPKSLTLKIFLNDWQWDLNLLATSFCNHVCICNQIYQLLKSLTSKIKKKLLVGCLYFWPLLLAIVFAFAIKFGLLYFLFLFIHFPSV